MIFQRLTRSPANWMRVAQRSFAVDLSAQTKDGQSKYKY